jgi:hypothetical protein
MVAKGKIIDIIHSEKVTNLVIMNKLGNTKKYLPMCFTAFIDIKRLIMILKIEKGDFVKINYNIFSKKYGEKYYTTLFIENLKLIEKNNHQLSVNLDGEYIN